MTVIPKAVATGRCEIRADSTVFRVETNARGRATGVAYWDREGRERRQTARAVVLAANGAETTRLLLMSASPAFPDGLANSSGNVGRYIMFNGHSGTFGRFEHPLNEYKGAVASRIVHDFYDTDPKRGFYGGGGIDARFPLRPDRLRASTCCRTDVPAWGAGLQARAARLLHALGALCMRTSRRCRWRRNTVTLDAAHPDRWGRPGLLPNVPGPSGRHEGAGTGSASARSEMMEAAGATHVWNQPILPTDGGVHLLGTARMGNDPRDSVVDRYHRAHDVPNLFICDGSSFVTSGRGQPTMTIQALAFRAAEHIARFARANAI